MIRRKNVRLIKQRPGRGDCAVCCLAMLTGIPYDKVVKLIGNTYHPDKGMMDDDTALERLGLRKKHIPVKGLKGAFHIEYVDYKPLYGKPYELSAEYWVDQIWGRRALLSVPSLNYKNGSHMVYWHYDRLFDPSTKKTYKEFKELKPTEIVLFMEKP